MTGETLFQVISPYFCCGLVIINGKVTDCAPIIKYMKEWDEGRALTYCRKKQWLVKRVRHDNDMS